MRFRGIGILPMIHGLEGDPQREILRWGPQAHATTSQLLKHLLSISGRLPILVFYSE